MAAINRVLIDQISTQKFGRNPVDFFEKLISTPKSGRNWIYLVVDQKSLLLSQVIWFSAMFIGGKKFFKIAVEWPCFYFTRSEFILKSAVVSDFSLRPLLMKCASKR